MGLWSVGHSNIHLRVFLQVGTLSCIRAAFKLNFYSLVSYASINSGCRVVLAHRGVWKGSVDGCSKAAQTRSDRHAEGKIGSMNGLSQIKTQW